MSEQMLNLCELQLAAVLADLDDHTAEVSVAAGRLMQVCKAGASGVGPHSLLARVNAEACRIVSGLQFHDELAQRLSHVVDLLRLLREDDGDAAGNADPAALLERVCGIFSSQAEFSQLVRVFPEREVEHDPLLVELFGQE